MKNATPVVLLVDDDRADQEIIKRIAEQGATSARLVIVSSGQDALDYLAKKNKFEGAGDAPTPDLILLDLNMPGLTGLDVLSRIRNDTQTKRIPVVVLTTSDREADVLQSYERGANTYLTKPVKFEEFVRVVRELDEYWFGLAQLPRQAAKNTVYG